MVRPRGSSAASDDSSGTTRDQVRYMRFDKRVSGEKESSYEHRN
jgi:hypothetical protein